MIEREAEGRLRVSGAPRNGGAGFRPAMRYGVLLLVLAALLMPALAHAQMVSGGTSPTTILDNIATFILGPFGQAIAVLSVIGIGVAFMFGRASLGLVGSLVGGLVLIFGASYLITQFVGGG